MAGAKSAACDKMDWREQIREEIQSEIERQVREALDTPPLERIKRNKEKAKQRRIGQAELSRSFFLGGPKKSALPLAAVESESNWEEMNDWRRQTSKREGRNSSVKDRRLSLTDSCNEKKEIWKAHQKLNAHVEAIITDARKNWSKSRKLFNFADQLGETEVLHSRRNYRRAVENGVQKSASNLQIPSRYKKLMERMEKEMSDDDQSDDEEDSDSVNESESEKDESESKSERLPKAPPALPRDTQIKSAELSASATGEIGEPSEDETSQVARIGAEAFQNFGALTLKERQYFFFNFTHTAFKSAMLSGKLPDGSPVDVVQVGKRKAFKDRYGIIRDQFGPFWPKEYGPLHPAPAHKRLSSGNKNAPEPLLPALPTDGANNGTTNMNANSDTAWKSPVLVYDIEKSNRDCMPVNRIATLACRDPDLILRDSLIPPLWFESRFECGNLRQARRIGERTYELVVNNDLNTNRHTQWYYFRIRNAKPGVSYRFIFVNFMKPTSLYNQGMQPLLYSEKRANEEQVGWYRCGHHISYSRNMDHRDSALLRFSNEEFYQLDVCIEFPFDNDTYYVAHCYPYGFTDLKTDLEQLLAERGRADCMKRSVLCETEIGNACFLLTVTNFKSGSDVSAPAEASETELAELRKKNKKVVVISARVHPGESNASWMMKGLIEFLTSSDPVAVRLRDVVVFKIIPMLNPDGVIVGNYRCSLSGRDMNRNYRHPKEHKFPTVWHIKEMMKQMAREHQVLLYCDLHGHSRQSSSFLYGCDSAYLQDSDCSFDERKNRQGTPESFLEERLFAWLMAALAGEDLFSFRACKYSVKRCKEATGRVVIWRQLAIDRSFTLEVSFSGTALSRPNAHHFRTCDLEAIGMKLAQCVDEYMKVRSDVSLLRSAYAAMMSHFLTLSTVGNDNHLLKDDPKADNFQHGAKTVDNFKQWHATRPINDDESDCDSNSDAEPEMLSDPESESASPPFEENDQKLTKAMSRRVLPAKTKKTTSKRSSLPSVPANSNQRRMSQPVLPVTKQKRIPGDRNGVPYSPSPDFLSRHFVAPVATSEPAKVDEVQSKKFVNPYDRLSNGGIPCFALKRALERTELKLGQLRTKFENDPEKLEALESEYCKQIEQIQKRLNELTNMPASLSSALTIVLDESHESAVKGESGRAERQVSLRSILFEPNSIFTNVNIKKSVHRGHKVRHFHMAKTNAALARTMASQNMNTSVAESIRARKSQWPNGAENEFLTDAAANGQVPTNSAQRIPPVSQMNTYYKHRASLPANARFSEPSHEHSTSDSHELSQEDEFAMLKSKINHDPYIMQQKLLQLRFQERENQLRSAQQRDKGLFDRQFIVPQASSLRPLPNVPSSSLTPVNYRLKRMLDANSTRQIAE